MLLYWIWFAELKNISLLQKNRLLESFNGPEELYHTSEEALKRMGLADNIRQALQERDLKDAEQILRECTQKGIKLLPIADSAYPERLRNTPDAPVLLYYKGVLPDWNSVPFIGIVGTRKCSAYGLQVAYQMGSQIANSGGHIVSGGASGIDTAALQGAIEAGQTVVIVLGFGADVVYPRGNRRLFEHVGKYGCLVTEYPPGIKALGWHFPARNRIISGLSNGVLVVEAPKISGALITARDALEQGRDVFVVPGNIDMPTCEGSNALLQEGAIPVLSGWDVLSCYESLYPDRLHKHKIVPPVETKKPMAKVAETPLAPENTETPRKKLIDNGANSTYSVLENTKPALSREEQAVLAKLTRDPQEPAELIARLEMPSGKVLSILTMLAIKGLVIKHPGGRFSVK